MNRISPLPRDEWDDETIAAFSPREGRLPPPNNALDLLARHPLLAKSFMRYNAYVLNRSALPVVVRELAILRVAWRRRCRYEWAHHVKMAREAGVTDAQIEQVRAGGPTLLNRVVDELDERSRLSDETYREIAAELGDDRALMDLVFTVGTYALLSMVFTTFDLPLDEGTADEGFDGALGAGS
ncbi:carboxymuconolactone decarboxylase family protein [Actinomadura sp. KC345]|uniref:carboxymuconolactone decarboxylase family protein n=1 Tax=Actinomadura sp. KC345 TaxID=2530371 RepID=UPI0010504570|nr:carboxymuconolactone decarboxylase family protein [Actinomadura sp. KC345]TDC56764.1 carboxymuconolactone decarboxylase family protein [Actinomadura sp. KC345]